jgi:hypothetical protein
MSKWYGRKGDVVIPDVTSDQNIHPILYICSSGIRPRIAPDAISLQKTTISFGEDVAKWLGTDWVQVGIDPVTKTLLLKPSSQNQSNAIHCYKSKHDKTYRFNSYVIRCWIMNSFKQDIAKDHYKAVWSQQLNAVKITYRIN